MRQPPHNIRKLVAIDIVFLGYKLIFAEYLFGVVGSLGLGIFALVRSHSPSQIALGVYLVSLGINYAPMLAYAVSIASNENARAELGDELIEQRKAMTKYRRISLLLLVPLVVPFLALSRQQTRPSFTS